MQELGDQTDREGAGGGKENVPPGYATSKTGKSSTNAAKKALRVSIFEPPMRDGRQNSIMRETGCVDKKGQAAFASQLKKQSTHQRHTKDMKDDVPTTACCGRSTRNSITKKRNFLYYGRITSNISQNENSTSHTRFSHKSERSGLRMSQTLPLQYEVLEEAIEHPEMYENAWLRYLETVIQQLVNDLLERNGHKEMHSPRQEHGLRDAILKIYQESENVLLYRRLQASLMYGALNPPKAFNVDAVRLKDDLGLRKRFISLWMDNYDDEVLLSAAEVVIGRKIANNFISQSFKGSVWSDNQFVVGDRQKAIKSFLETCLLDNEDSQEDCDREPHLWGWRKTMQRSLMLIMLLDQAKEKGIVQKNIFKPTSKAKSSYDVLTEYLSLMSPYTGPRPLQHLSYHVQHIQMPLSEYVYKITNLATDLRDGVILTRLAEILMELDVEETMPEYDHQKSSSLSKQLMVPCLSNVQKSHNVEIAFCAMRTDSNLAHVLDGMQAEHIYNGHRERTISLLWKMVYRTGLNVLVDFDQLDREVCRLKRPQTTFGITSSRSTVRSDEIELEIDGEKESNRKIFLLKRWAKAVARSRGLQVQNFTTSFADGKIFEAIVDEYRPHRTHPSFSQSSRPNRLCAKLKAIGCSHSFGRF